MSEELEALSERAKELDCFYQVFGLILRHELAPQELFGRLLELLPDGWQRPGTTGASLEYLGRRYVGAGYQADAPQISKPIRLGDREVGSLSVSDTAELPENEAVFLEEEVTLLGNVAIRLAEYLERKHSEILGAQVPPAAWLWRQHYAESLARALDRERFGVESLYLGGSTADGSAGPGSDIDLYCFHTGSSAQREQFKIWLEGWSLCLAEMAHRQTGYRFNQGMINVRWLSSSPHPNLCLVQLL